MEDSHPLTISTKKMASVGLGVRRTWVRVPALQLVGNPITHLSLSFSICSMELLIAPVLGGAWTTLSLMPGMI